MSRIILGKRLWRACRALPPIAAALVLASCASGPEIVAPHLRPLPKDTMMLLGKKGMDAQTPIFIRIFKEDSELEVWKQRDDGRYYHFKTYPVCNWSGELGPKLLQGDRQAPEGFYTITREQMNPDSKYHLAMNLGYPNAYDRSHRRTGEFLMIHGKCKSAGCYAMTDALMEEIYAMARESFLGGHDGLAVCSRRYHVNVAFRGNATRLDPEGACPIFVKPRPDPFRPKPGEQIAEQRIIVPGPKTRGLASYDDGTQRSGLMSTGTIGQSAPAPVPSMGLAPNR
jgi:murein L,D-transpeptidase YafK